MFDKGKTIENRKCFVNANTKCKKCKVCSVVHGCGGAGSFSDSKLNFDTSGRIGGDLYELLTKEEITEYLRRTYEIYKEFGIEEFQSKVYGKYHNEEALEILKKIESNPNMDMIDCQTIHLGTENSRIIYKRMLDFLKENNVEIIDECEIIDIVTNGEENEIWYSNKNPLYNVHEYKVFNKIVLAMGRSGNKLIRDICETNGIKMKNGRVDYGVRIECPNEVMKPLNDNFYEAKIYMKGKFGDVIRTFCTNPSGYIAIESYPYNGDRIYTVNGHAYANKKSNNTNFALLVSRNFNDDCPNPLEDYLYPLIQATNSLGKGSVILQSLKDIELNRRSTKERISELDITPTADVYAGDLTSVIPYRTLVDILEAIKELDKICPGIYGENTLLYGLEAKFSSNKVDIDKYGKTSVDNIYCIGDCSGYTRGLTSASSMGIMCAINILNKF